MVFKTMVFSGGYEWAQDAPGAGSPADESLETWPALRYRDDGSPFYPDGFDPFEDTGQWQVRSGREMARSAFNAFIKLARALDQTNDMPTQKRLVLEYANQYGRLLRDGGGEHRRETIDTWLTETGTFLDLYDVSRAIQKSSFRDIRDRIVRHEAATGALLHIDYRCRSRHGRKTLRIANHDERYRHQPPGAPQPEILNPVEMVTSGPLSDRHAAWLVLAREVNRTLTGGVSMVVSFAQEDRFEIQPTALKQLLYLRLWMDTVKREDLERATTCLNCGHELQGTRRKKYCDDRCRTEYNNRRRAAS